MNKTAFTDAQLGFLILGEKSSQFEQKNWMQLWTPTGRLFRLTPVDFWFSSSKRQRHESFKKSRIKLEINIKRVYRHRPGRVFCVTRLWSFSKSETLWVQESTPCVLFCRCTSDIRIAENIKGACYSLGLLSYFHALVSQLHYSSGIWRVWKHLNYHYLFFNLFSETRHDNLPNWVLFGDFKSLIFQFQHENRQKCFKLIRKWSDQWLCADEREFRKEAI